MSDPFDGNAKIAGRYDLSVPVLVFQVSRYPLLYGSLGAIRSLGRAGIACSSVVLAPLSPHGYSRYLSKSYSPDDDWTALPASMLEALHEIGNDIGTRAMLLPTDDEAAVFAAEHADELEPRFLLPRVPPHLPGLLASKHGLAEACASHGITTPRTGVASTHEAAMTIAGQIGYPIVLKNSDPWSRLLAPVVSSTTVFRDALELLQIKDAWQIRSKAIVQEFIPDADAEDWIVHVYCGSGKGQNLVFTGRKYRSWPPCGGVTTAAASLRNETLAELATRFCREMGFQGIADMDWRFDRRDQTYKLVDFNPRLGANFRLFQTEAGIDVVRAQHLDLTGREIPQAPPAYGRQFRVENLDWASCLAPVNKGRPAPDLKIRSREYAWFATDDMLPFLVMLVKFSGLAMVRVKTVAQRRLKAMTSLPGARQLHRMAHVRKKVRDQSPQK